jgi:hypothetical protein
VAEKNIEAMRQRTNWGDLLEPEAVVTPAEAKERQQWRWPDW